MTDTVASLRRKITGANDLQSVVRVMKAVAATSIGQYERSAEAVAAYSRTIEVGLGACFRRLALLQRAPEPSPSPSRGAPNAVVFGSDQGLVGPFNEVVVDFALEVLLALPGGRPKVWAVGERAHTRLADSEVVLMGSLPVPSSIDAIAPLVGQILIDHAAQHPHDDVAELYLFYNRPTVGVVYVPFGQRLLPLDTSWQRSLAERPWPVQTRPEVIGDGDDTLRALVREYLFVSLFRACAESLASENASRLAAMQRADKNIDDLLDNLEGAFHRLRQSSIDEELFDVIAGANARDPGLAS